MGRLDLSYSAALGAAGHRLQQGGSWWQACWFTGLRGLFFRITKPWIEHCNIMDFLLNLLITHFVFLSNFLDLPILNSCILETYKFTFIYCVQIRLQYPFQHIAFVVCNHCIGPKEQIQKCVSDYQSKFFTSLRQIREVIIVKFYLVMNIVCRWVRGEGGLVGSL